jgi:hypothetical protein
MRFRTLASLAGLSVATGLALPGVVKAEMPDQQAQIRTQEPDTVLASKLRNASVYAPDESRVGDINDLIIKMDGKVDGVVVGVGGFLGIGEKNVALKLDRFKVTPEPDGRVRVVLTATKDELRALPDFKSKDDERSQQQQEQNKPQSGGTQPKS